MPFKKTIFLCHTMTIKLLNKFTVSLLNLYRSNRQNMNRNSVVYFSGTGVFCVIEIFSFQIHSLTEQHKT